MPLSIRSHALRAGKRFTLSPEPVVAVQFARKRSASVIHTLLSSIAIINTVLPAASVSASPAIPSASDVHPLEIPAGPLSQALLQFSLETGIKLKYDPASINKLTTRGVVGASNHDAALHQLLDGTGLQAAPSGDGSYTLGMPATKSKSANSDVYVLDTVNVVAARNYASNSINAATGMTLSTRQTPQSISVITSNLMEDANITNVASAVAQAPGIISISKPSVGGIDEIYSRGYLLQNYMLDGAPTASAAVSQDAYQGLSSIDSAAYETVTVVRGATGLLSGAGEPSGTVALTHKRPTRELLGSLSQSAGHWGQHRTTVDIGGPLSQSGQLRGRLVSTYDAGGDWHEGYRYNKISSYGVLETDLTNRLLATLQLDANRNHSTGGAGGNGYAIAARDGTPLFFSRRSNPQVDWSYFESKRVGGSGAITYRIADDWKASFNYSHYELTYDSEKGGQRRQHLPRRNGDFDLEMLKTRSDSSSDSVTLKVDGQYHLLDRKHELSIGLIANQSKTDTPTYLRTIRRHLNIYTWNRQSPRPNWANVKNAPITNKTKQSAVFVSSRFRATDKLSLLAGTRWSNWSNKYENRTFNDVQHLREHGVFTPYYGIVFDATDNLSPYASYTSIFKVQNAQDVLGHQLDPEVGSNVEAGLKGEWYGGRLNASISVFQVKRDNLAVPDGNKRTPDGLHTAYVGIDNVKGRGWELEIEGEIRPRWKIQGGFTRMRTYDSNHTLLNSQQPRDFFKLFTSWSPTNLQQLTLGGGATWQSKTYDSGEIESLRALYSQKGYAVFDLMLGYRFTGNLSLMLNIENLFDKAYRTNLYEHTYGAPRNINATLRYDF